MRYRVNARAHAGRVSAPAGEETQASWLVPLALLPVVNIGGLSLDENSA